MAASGNLPHQGRSTIRNPAHSKEGSLGVEFVEDIENPSGIVHNPQRELIPFCSMPRCGHGLRLKVVFNVYAKQRPHRGPHRLRRRDIHWDNLEARRRICFAFFKPRPVGMLELRESARQN